MQAPHVRSEPPMDGDMYSVQRQYVTCGEDRGQASGSVIVAHEAPLIRDFGGFRMPISRR